MRLVLETILAWPGRPVSARLRPQELDYAIPLRPCLPQGFGPMEFDHATVGQAWVKGLRSSSAWDLEPNGHSAPEDTLARDSCHIPL